MDQNLLYPCTRLPDENDQADEDHVKWIVSNYVVTQRLGKGATSVVAQLSIGEKATTVAAKLMILNKESIRDLGIASELNELQSVTPLFNQTHGWCLLNGIPEEWQYSLGDYPERFNHEILLCQIMDEAEQEFANKNILLAEKEIKSCLFVALQGLKCAIDAFDFKHGDLHEKQLLLRVVYNKTLTIAINDEDVEIETVRYFPKLIDFGMASTLKFRNQSFHSSRENESFSSEGGSDFSFEGESNMTFIPETSDIDLMLEIFHDKLKMQYQKRKNQKDLEVLQRYEKMIIKHHTKDIQSLLFESGYFDSIILNRRLRTKSIEKCMVCHAVATHEWQGTNYVFLRQTLRSLLGTNSNVAKN